MVLDSNFFSSIFAFLVLVYWIMHMVGFCCDFLSCNQVGGVLRDFFYQCLLYSERC